MGSCQLKRGFFLLRQCGNPSSYICPECQREVCALHIKVQASGILCFDCALQSENTPVDPSDDDDVFDNDYDADQYRKNYYQNSKFKPKDSTSDFNSQDTQAFDHSSTWDGDEDHHAKTSFGDS